ncbi:hypothetical protein K492DRAFT_10338 [Lichtheimia hyalospora FSU 10163]|nr:hypothetical protein K492DRAFT_10338 [Lichtheimia hyalospora FSU 10163]
MATLQSPIDMDISDGSNSDMDVSESDQETESGPIKTMSSKQTTTYTPISPFTSTQYYPRTTSDAAMLGYTPGNQFASNTQNMMTNTRTDMMNPFFFNNGGGGYNQPMPTKRSIHLNPYMANGIDGHGKKAQWRQQATTTLEQRYMDDSDKDSYHTAESDFEDDEEPGLIKTDQDEMDGLQAELHRYKQEISTLDERLDEIGKKKQRLEQDVLRLRVHQSMKKNRKRVANQNTTLERHQNNSSSNLPSKATKAIPNPPMKAKQEQQQQHINVSPISKASQATTQQQMPRPPIAPGVPSLNSGSASPYKMQQPKSQPVIPAAAVTAKPVSTIHTASGSHHRQWIAPFVGSSSKANFSQSPGNNANLVTIPPTNQPTRSPAFAAPKAIPVATTPPVVTTPKTRPIAATSSVVTTPKTTSIPMASSIATAPPKVASPETTSPAVKEAWLVESIPRTYAPPLRGPKKPSHVKEAPLVGHLQQEAAPAATSQTKRYKGAFKPYESPLTRLGIGSQKRTLPLNRVKRGLCRFETGGGTCNDDTCPDLHFRDLEGTSSSH